MAPIEDLRKEAQTEFDKVNPTYYAALEALASLDIADIFEVRSFTCPPKGVVLVMKAVCLLFDVEQTFVSFQITSPRSQTFRVTSYVLFIFSWEAAKLLLLRSNFFQDMEFFKKDSIPQETFDQLRLFIEDPEFQVKNSPNLKNILIFFINCNFVIFSMNR